MGFCCYLFRREVDVTFFVFYGPMCGITGIFLTSQTGSKAVECSLEAIKHRGPDESFIVGVENKTPVFFSCNHSSAFLKQHYPSAQAFESKSWLGYNRLAIVDTSYQAGLPLYDEEDDCLFLMNGEVYNYRQLKSSFLNEVSFKSATDTEVAFKLYLKLGDSFIQHLRGMFTIVAFHPGKKLVKVWRDRFGIKPFFYAVNKDFFIFSSEVSGIHASGFVQPAIDFEKLGQQFYLGASLSPSTIYRHVHSLEPAGHLVVNTNTFDYKTSTYWQLSYQPSKKPIPQEEFVHDVKEIVDLSLEGVEAIKKSIMISGGLDSGLLALFLSKASANLKGATIYDDSGRQVNELPYTKLNAAHAGIELDMFRVPDQMSGSMIEEFCKAEEEPNISPEPAYFLSSQLRGKKRILYNALGPDELFYGYGHYAKALTIKRWQPMLHMLWDGWLPSGKREKFRTFKRYGLPALPFISRSVAGWEEIKRLFRDHSSANWQHPLELVWAQAKVRFADFEDCDVMKKISFLDIYFYLSSYHSLRSDRPSMMNAIEMRFPYLDHLFFQKYFNVYGSEKGLQHNNYKPLFRNYARDILHPDIFQMPKTGFNMNGINWSKSVDWGEIKSKLRSVVSASSTDSFATTSERKWLLMSLAHLLP